VAGKPISTTGELAFGRLVAGAGGSISIGITSARSRSGGVILLPSPAGAASFALEGNNNKIAILTLPDNGSVYLVSGANRMAVNQFVSSHAGGTTLPPAGALATVGATLQVAPNQAPGSYAGSFHVTLEFQ
jgi:hypothetical protein